MQISDWLAITGIVMSTIMSVISIAVALHIYRREQKGRRDKEQQSTFLAWLLLLVKELTEVIPRKVSEIIGYEKSRDTTTPVTPTPHPSDQYDYTEAEEKPDSGGKQGEDVSSPSRSVHREERPVELFDMPQGEPVRGILRDRPPGYKLDDGGSIDHEQDLGMPNCNSSGIDTPSP